MRQNRINQAGGARGFTLLEVLLAIGVLTFVAVAISQIFGSIGDTLNRGKRISELNQFASRIESVMRRDFENLSRDGFLVIRNEYADAGRDIALFDGDADPRPRRVDQIMFFGSGDYTSSRSDIYAGLTPRSGEARIYYGHGQMRSPDYGVNSPYLKPDLRDNMLDFGMRLGQASLPGVPNPNEYAADWTLLRNVTVLTPPAAGLAQTLPDYQDGGLYGYNADRDAVNFSNTQVISGFAREAVLDNAFQVKLQPAITSIFWNAQPFSFGGITPDDPGYIKPVVNPVWIGFGNTGQQVQNARFSSGLVDVATTSLAQIQSIVSAAAFKPNEFDSNLVNRTWLYRYLRFDHGQEALDSPPPYPARQGTPKRYPFTVTSPAEQRAWMINALPVHPAERRQDAEIFDPQAGQVTSPRIRYETIPPDLAGSLTDAGGNQSGTNKRLENAYAAANQEMLTRSIFVPRCTEFIVDWSFGEVFDNYSNERARELPDLERVVAAESIANLGNSLNTPVGRARWKKFVWYGRDGWTLAPDGLQADLDGDGDRNYDPDDRTTFFYEIDHRRAAREVERAIDRYNSKAIGDPLLNQYPSQEYAIEMAKASARNPEHFVGRTSQQEPDDSTINGRRTIETTTFGYYVYDPGILSQNFRDDLVINWPWPKLIRITFKLADPNDPGIETAYQVVFKVPSRESD